MGNDKSGAHPSGNAGGFHAALVARILENARRYASRPRRRMVDVARKGESRRKGQLRSAGEDIRNRIAANARRRVEIAEAMKREAGVKAHDLTGENDGGLAWTHRAHILAPAGENRVQLATLAHECGHIFLHAAGTAGHDLPSHVKEIEAESYAHQAFVEYGMRMPTPVSLWGRTYVGEWVAEDRANGISIDARVEAYVAGTRSPYEPLRKVPATWRHHQATPAVRVIARPPTWVSWFAEQRRLLLRIVGHEGGVMANLVLCGFACGYFCTVHVLELIRVPFGIPKLFPMIPRYTDLDIAMEAVCGGLAIACVAVLWRTMTWMPKVRPRD